MFKVLGITDEVTTCECCGRTNLKRTVALESEESGLVHYGTDCAAAAVYGKKSSSNRATMELTAKAVSYAAKWIGVYGRSVDVLEKIASRVRVMGPQAYVANGCLFVAGNPV